MVTLEHDVTLIVELTHEMECIFIYEFEEGRWGFKVDNIDHCKVWNLMAALFHNDATGKYYVHPSSNHIFEPQEGDKNIEGFEFRNGFWRCNKIMDEPCYHKINQRNNKTFFMPKLIGEE